MIAYYLLNEIDDGSLLDDTQLKVDVALELQLWIDQVMISVSHWLFAVEYLRLALKFPLMLRQLGEEEI